MSGRPSITRREALALALGTIATTAATTTAATVAGAQEAVTAPTEAPPVPKLGEELTPFGAIRAGNRTRAIPAWTGGLTRAPRGYVPGRPSPNPYIEDGRWFTVGPNDVERYKIRLSAGLQALLAKHPDSFEVPVFPCRRSAAAPQAVYDASLENAGRAALGNNGLVLTGARVGVPFPIPANGVQAMWNHLLRWRGTSLTRTGQTILPSATGALDSRLYREDVAFPYAAGEESGRPLLYRRTTLMPKEQEGSVLLAQATLNPIQSGFRAWFRQGERGRVVPAPDFLYDTPDPATDGIATADMLDMFSGPLDRFDFTLVSRREMYVPYNAYRLNTAGLAPSEFMWYGHPNPQFLRYELHRVWIVDARLKPNFQHALPDRTYYLDEDSWQIVMAEHYNGKGELLRYAEAHNVAHWQVPAFLPAVEFVHDLTTDRYVARGIDNLQRPPIFDKPLKPEEFTPESLVRRGRRG
ncbi:hypothetical protein J2847_004620 [Azospirillum agricola]|uniref:DUF1329 domain-containing protein n=1 Tax=Azospirillum agricola TaxID=1720247 RepID=UPI001AE68A57|nr:DUF1329 domain-containing protein [Azospirillum agricola]MBP2231308.1 hypothetical protein [Azospirillum agricola]